MSKQNPTIYSQILYAILGALFIAGAAQVTFDVPINGNAIKITGQSLMVLLFAYSFKNYTGVWAVLLYLLLGGLGLPFFADGSSGFDTFAGASGGYLYGFIGGAAAMPFFSRKDWDKNFLKSLVAFIVGTAVILAFGLLHLSFFKPEGGVLQAGFYPFLSGAAIKAILGAAFWPIYYMIDGYYKNKA